jgi:hypothetical protein
LQIEPTTFRTWLRILDKVPKAILWLLRFPDLGESNLKRTAQEWAGESVASRIWFTDVAPKHQHISRARVCDLFLDTPECNAHTTAADILRVLFQEERTVARQPQSSLQRMTINTKSLLSSLRVAFPIGCSLPDMEKVSVDLANFANSFLIVDGHVPCLTQGDGLKI